MSAKPKRTTIPVSQDALSVFSELSEKTRIPLFQIMEELSKEIRVIIKDGLPESDRINYMPKAFMDKSCVVLFFNSMFCGTSQESLEQLKEKLKL